MFNIQYWNPREMQWKGTGSNNLPDILLLHVGCKLWLSNVTIAAAFASLNQL